MPEDRRLAAIMFTDIVGYTALMGSDEDKAFRLLRKNRDLHRPLIKKYRGEWLKEMGDGILASFHTSSDAVRCAIELQRNSMEEGIGLRIGIHQGEVVFEGKDVFGDGVNVASRLEALAPEGGIYISGAVYKDIRNKAGISTEFAEEKILKNVDEPVKIYSVKPQEPGPGESGEKISGTGKSKFPYYLMAGIVVVLIAIAAWQFWPTKEAAPVKGEVESAEIKRSIAVLPFKNFSGDPDQEYMCDGLTDEIINHLFKIESFDKVVSLSSVLTYKESGKRIPQIAEELEVNYILEGTYKKLGDQVRVTAQLIEPENDKHIWQNQYDQPYKEIISIQADIALQIADHLKAFIRDSEKEGILYKPTMNEEAYQALLRSRYFLITSRDLDSAQLFAERAIKLDPEFSTAHALLGIIKLINGTLFGTEKMSRAAWDSKPHLEKALEINPEEYVANFAMALIYEWAQWDYIRANKQYLKIQDMLPNNLDYPGLYAEFLMKMNRLEDAIEYCKMIFEIDTTVTPYNVWIKSLILQDKKEEASQIFKSKIDLNNVNISGGAQPRGPTLRALGDLYMEMAVFDSALFYDSALYYFEKAEKVLGSIIHNPKYKTNKAIALYKLGHYIESDEIIQQFIRESQNKEEGKLEYFIGRYYSYIGDTDSAFYWLEKAYEMRSPEFPHLKVDPAFKSIRDDNRYWNLYERTGHKAYDEYMKNERIRNSNKY